MNFDVRVKNVFQGRYPGGNANVTIVADGVTLMDINDCRIVQKKDGGFFVTTPQKQIEKNGEKKYSSIVFVINEDLKKKIETEVLNEYHKAAGAADKLNAPTASAPDSESIPF